MQTPETPKANKTSEAAVRLGLVKEGQPAARKLSELYAISAKYHVMEQALQTINEYAATDSDLAVTISRNALDFDLLSE